jgi:hypothetical protein
LEADQWTGYACVTGSGLYAIATYAPTWFANDTALRDRGAFAAVVNLDDGTVRQLADRVSLKYHTPGCGLKNDAVLTRNLGDDQQSTEILVVDAVTASVTARMSTEGQLTSVVPGAGGVFASAGEEVVVVDSKGVRPFAQAQGVPFELQPASDGGVDFLAADRTKNTATAEHATASAVARVGDAPLGAIRLFAGRSGQNQLTGTVGHVASVPGGPRVLQRARVPAFLSPDGKVVVDEARSATQAEQGAVHIEASDPRSGRSLTQSVTPDAVRTSATTPSSKTTPPAKTSPALAAPPDGSPCAVPRNDYHYQVLQPTPVQVEWAADQAVKGALNVSRPANWNNDGVGSYTPQTLFPPVSGSPQVPAQILLGVLAQESNLKQASYHASPGDGGNPLVADYYGAGGSLEYTDHMRADDPTFSDTQKVAIALDYAANIAAGLQNLQTKWIQLSQAGVLVNGGDPQFVENWYLAAWAYNTGFHPNLGGGQPWGLGWSNNPANADYPPDRAGFLRASYADASHPGDWPYQERVMGWAETPQVDIHGSPSYTPTAGRVSLPGPYQFCVPQANQCDQHYVGVPYSVSFCTRADRMCWWHQPTTWTACPGSCHSEVVAFASGASEPVMHADHAPRCSGGLPAGAVVVDDVPNASWNVVGCGASPSAGTFNIAYGTDGAGVPTSQIDFHQIGSGYGGHYWFTHTESFGQADNAHTVTATWQPPSLSGWYQIYVHIPDHGADTGQAHYTVDLGGGASTTRVVAQRWNANTWANLGVMHIASGGGAITSNNMTETDWGVSQPVDIAWDAVGYVPSSQPTQSYVALGDSYSAGEGVEPFDTNSDVGGDTPGFRDACHRSSTGGYPRMIAPSGAGTDFHDIACSGSVIANLTGPATNWNESPQLAQGYLDANTTLVTLTVGGNDARFAAVLKGCTGLSNCLDPNYHLTTDQGVDSQALIVAEPTAIDNLRQPLIDLYSNIKAKAPNAEVIVAGYPLLFPPDGFHQCVNIAGISSDEAKWINTMGDRLDTVIAAAAVTAGVRFADPRAAFAGHYINCAGTPQWINGLIATSNTGSGLAIPGSGSFHPNGAGQAAYASVVQAAR